jgi:hypothetical protein
MEDINLLELNLEITKKNIIDFIRKYVNDLNPKS